MNRIMGRCAQNLTENLEEKSFLSLQAGKGASLCSLTRARKYIGKEVLQVLLEGFTN